MSPTSAFVMAGLLSVSIVPLSSVREDPVRSLVASESFSLGEILEALRAVESGGIPDPSLAVGDGGEAIGPFQIHRAYWMDAGVLGTYEDCRDAGYAERVVTAYWRRYCPEALRSLDAEVLARTHNGGPRGAAKSSTFKFWEKVRRELAESRSRRAPGVNHET